MWPRVEATSIPSVSFPSFPVSPPLSLLLLPRTTSEFGFSKEKQMPRNLLGDMLVLENEEEQG